MIRSVAFFILLTAIGALAENKGFCPASRPPKPKEIPAKAPPTYGPDPTAEFAGTVWLQIVINEKGYVCSVQVLRGFDKVADQRAVNSARQWHLNPARYKGRAVVAVVMVDVNFWRRANGELIQVPADWNGSSPSTLKQSHGSRVTSRWSQVKCKCRSLHSDAHHWRVFGRDDNVGTSLNAGVNACSTLSHNPTQEALFSRRIAWRPPEAA
jgi:hypothetical protein